MFISPNKKSEEILTCVTMIARSGLSEKALEKFNIHELRIARRELPLENDSPELKAIEDRIKDLEAEAEGRRLSYVTNPKNVGRNTRLRRKVSKRKSELNDDLSEIDKSTWKRPREETLIFRKIRKTGDPGTILRLKSIEVDDPETFLNPKEVKIGDYKFYIKWKGCAPKELEVKKPSHLDTLLTLFIIGAKVDSIVSRRDIKKYLETKQPPNKAVGDVNDALVIELRRKFPREIIPDLIFGYSKKKDGYITLIPIEDESSLDAIDEEERLYDEPTKEFLSGSQTIKRGVKKM